MKIAKMVLTWMLSFCNLFRFLMPINKNKITFISMTQDHLEYDFLAIANYLKEHTNYELHYNLIIFKKSLVDNFKYMLNCFKQLYEINTSKVIILNDNNFVVTRFKRSNTTVIQLWHACGAIKKFGNQLSTRQYLVENYDYVISNSEYWKAAYSEAFHVQQQQVKVLGMPRVDVFFNQDVMKQYQTNFYQRYPQLKDKYKILYAPTFRGNVIDGLYIPSIDFKKILNAQGEDTYILCKLHPLVKDYTIEEDEHIINVSNDELYELLCVCDCLISDYSSIFFDYSLLNKKAICYAPDYKHYEKAIGYNVDYYEAMCAKVCENEQDICKQLKKKDYDFGKMKSFQERFMPFMDGKNTERVCDFIVECMEKL